MAEVLFLAAIGQGEGDSHALAASVSFCPRVARRLGDFFLELPADQRLSALLLLYAASTKKRKFQDGGRGDLPAELPVNVASSAAGECDLPVDYRHGDHHLHLSAPSAAGECDYHFDLPVDDRHGDHHLHLSAPSAAGECNYLFDRPADHRHGDRLRLFAPLAAGERLQDSDPVDHCHGDRLRFASASIDRLRLFAPLAAVERLQDSDPVDHCHGDHLRFASASIDRLRLFAPCAAGERSVQRWELFDPLAPVPREGLRSDDTPYRAGEGDCVLLLRRPLLLALHNFSGPDIEQARRFSVEDAYFACAQADREHLRVALPWLTAPAMTTPCLLLIYPHAPFGSGSGMVLLPWHFGSWCGEISGLPSPHTRLAEALPKSIIELDNDVLRSVDSFLRPEDSLNFRLSCREALTSLPWIINCSLTPLLLVVSPSGSNSLGLYSPLARKVFLLCNINSFNFQDIVFFASHQEWLLLQNKGLLYLLNLFNNVKREIPLPPTERTYTLMTLRVQEPHGIHIFAVHTPDPYTVLIGEYTMDGWDEHTFASEPADFVLSALSNPIRMGGSYYCLGIDGTIGIYTDEHWEILPMPDKRAFELSHAHLVALGTHLGVVLIGKRGTMLVLLDPVGRRWVDVPFLQNMSIFSGTRQTLMWSTTLDLLQNKVILPMCQKWLSECTGFLLKRADRWLLCSTEYRGQNEDSDKHGIWFCDYDHKHLDVNSPCGFLGNLWIDFHKDGRILAI